MACCRTESASDAGYASVAAITVALAIALIVTAMMARSVMDLRLARADFRKTQAEYELDGAQLLASLRVLSGVADGRLTWTEILPGGDPVTILAEPEYNKLGLQAASALDQAALGSLGASDPQAAAEGLARLSPATATPDQIADLDSGRIWRLCAASALSPWGQTSTLNLQPATAPTAQTNLARIGQVWRFVATSKDGWSDDRIVRLIGQDERPSAVIWRRLTRRGKGQQICRISLSR